MMDLKRLHQSLRGLFIALPIFINGTLNIMGGLWSIIMKKKNYGIASY